MAPWKIRTRFLVISDTHSQEFPDDRKPLHKVDVAIHCGDLTETSKLHEFDSSIRLLKDINASLKLVIPGNHDFTLDTPTFKRAIAEIPPPDLKLVEKEYGRFGEAKSLMKSCTHEGIVYLTEGVHHFDLDNGAHLAVYASPYTPSDDCWGFQFDPWIGHEREINDQVDVIMTHGPPKGILDINFRGEHIGCPELFKLVAQAKPLMHCFGHAHRSWGAELIKWRDHDYEESSPDKAIDMDESVTIGVRDRFSSRSRDKPRVAWQKENKEMSVADTRAVPTKHRGSDELPIARRLHTLFVNAAIQGSGDIPFNHPWLVELDLPIS
ncbi:ser thr phosphatase family [Fusarium sporotrichioides]|uniref:Ser thr phosphatase family n=1 Tax=Fusarium sporotrichioides TaxID=5514 RepID=A0A395RYF8_FUSSP|nr:ser thr phosphatase family [Fusarium sporotrichioides]